MYLPTHVTIVANLMGTTSPTSLSTITTTIDCYFMVLATYFLSSSYLSLSHFSSFVKMQVVHITPMFNPSTFTTKVELFKYLENTNHFSLVTKFFSLKL